MDFKDLLFYLVLSLVILILNNKNQLNRNQLSSKNMLFVLIVVKSTTKNAKIMVLRFLDVP